MEGALKSYEKDLHISRKYDSKLGKSRALDNIGRIYARTGQFEKAAEVWIEKEPLAKSNLERTWLFHEIGRSYLELDNNEGARDYGLKSLASAEKAGDEEWKMNANVLVAQAEFKLSNLQTAVTFFEKALDKATLLNDEAARDAITNALRNIHLEMEMEKRAKEEELELLREKQRAGMRDVPKVRNDDTDAAELKKTSPEEETAAEVAGKDQAEAEEAEAVEEEVVEEETEKAAEEEEEEEEAEDAEKDEDKEEDAEEDAEDTEEEVGQGARTDATEGLKEVLNV